MKYKTKFTVQHGKNKEYPIYLIIKDENAEDDVRKYDLWCEKEIYALAWWDIFTESIEDYKRGDLD